MNRRPAVAPLATALLLFGTAGCSTATMSPPAALPTSRDARPSESPGREVAPRAPLSAEACLIGQSCLELDARPFAPCLVATPGCERDAEFSNTRPDRTAS
jgi:hypothetical protein